MLEFELEPGESVKRVVRKHFLVLIGTAIPFALIAYLPYFLIEFLANGFPGQAAIAPWLSFGNRWVSFLVGIWWLVDLMFFMSAVTRFFLNQWVITTHRVVDIEQDGFFRREVSSVLLVHVQDVSTEITGFFHTLFNFGRIEVESAGAQEKFIMDGLNDPRGVRDLIMREVADLHLDDSGNKR